MSDNWKKELPPCPFCGDGDFRLKSNKYWTGMKYNTLSVELKHWCKDTDIFVSTIIIRGKTEEEVKTKWSSRVGAYA